MPTTTATLSIVSSDLTSDALSLSSTKSLNAAGVSTGLSQVEGVARKRLAGNASAVRNYTIANAGDAKFSANGASKIYIKNLSQSNADFVKIFVGTASEVGNVNGRELGRLYGGDFLFMPWSANESGDDSDIIVQTPANALNKDIEYLIIFE